MVLRYALPCLLFTLPAQADWSASITAASEYELTGISQSAEQAVLQTGVNYAWDSGWYVGSWSSSGIDFGCCDARLEVDYYAGYYTDGPASTRWDVSLNKYTYPGGDAIGYTENAMAFGWRALDVRFAWSGDFLNTGRRGHYLEAQYTHAMSAHWSLLVHAGKTGGPAFQRALIGFPAYHDYALGVVYSKAGFTTRLRRVEAVLPAADQRNNGVLRTTGRWVLDITYSLP